MDQSDGAESKKGFMTVSDNKDAYSFLYPFGWQVYILFSIFKHTD